MKVTKEMLNIELQPNYRILKISSRLLMNKTGIKLLNLNSARLRGKNIEGLDCEEKFIPSRNGGPDIRIRIFKPLNHVGPLPVMLYCHGGGYFIGSPEEFMTVIKKFIDAKPCIIIAPNYRKSFDAPYPAAFNDCYDTLLWMNENKSLLGQLSEQFIVAGHSAGGGLAAAVSLKATDTNDAKIAFQMPIYPMLDDRQNSESATNNNAPNWDSKSNQLAWKQYLIKTIEQGIETPSYAAPARATNYSNLPPTITFVGDVEPFRDETVAYTQQLIKSGIPVQFKLFKGCFHAFEILFPNLNISKEAWTFLLQAYKDHVDTYFYSKNEPI